MPKIDTYDGEPLKCPICAGTDFTWPGGRSTDVDPGRFVCEHCGTAVEHATGRVVPALMA